MLCSFCIFIQCLMYIITFMYTSSYVPTQYIKIYKILMIKNIKTRFEIYAFFLFSLQQI